MKITISKEMQEIVNTNPRGYKKKKRLKGCA